MNDDSRFAVFLTWHGNVQGVGLRRAVQRMAGAYKVSGWVRNRYAGHVQAHLEGTKSSVKSFMAALLTEANLPELSNFFSSVSEFHGFTDFSIIHPKDSASIQASVISGSVARAPLLNSEMRDIAKTIEQTELDDDPTHIASLRTLGIQIPPRFLGEPLAKKLRPGKLSFSVTDICCSFASENWTTTAAHIMMKSLGVQTPGNMINDKARGMRFARSLNIRTPKIFQSGVGIEKLDLQPGMVLKPTSGAGAKDVFCIYAADNIVRVVDRLRFESFDALLDSIRLSSSDAKSPKRWITEEMIFGTNDTIANDIKVYSFFGEAPIALEVCRTNERFEYCWWNRDCERINTGKYDQLQLTGTTMVPEYFELAERISALVPAPFLRIDFLKSADGPVFGEFTPRPGNFQDFDAATDAWLGRCYAEARGRLTADLMNGKRFTEYEAFVASIKKPTTKKTPKRQSVS